MADQVIAGADRTRLAATVGDGRPEGGMAGERPLGDAMRLRLSLEALTDIAGAVTQTWPLQALLDLIAERSCRLTAFDFCAVQLADRERTRLLIEGSYGLTQSYVRRVNSQSPIALQPGPFFDSPSSRAFRSGRAIGIGDTRTDPTFHPWELAADEQGYRTLLAVPLVVRGQAIGVMACYRTTPYDFRADETAFLSLIADQAAIAIHSSRLRASERRALEELRAANRALDEQTRHLERAEAMHRQLMDVVLAGGGFSEIASAVAQMLESPIVIETAEGEFLAVAPWQGRTATPPSEDQRRLAPLDDIPTSPRAKRSPVHVPVPPGAPLTGHNAMAPIVLDSAVVGRLWAVDADHEFGGLEMHVLERATVAVALEFLKERTQREVEARLTGDLLTELLADVDPDDQTALMARARQLGHDLTLHHTVVVADVGWSAHDGVSSSGLTDHRRSLLINAARRAGGEQRPKPVVGMRRQTLVVYLPETALHPTADQFTAGLRRELRAVLPGASPSIVIGSTVGRLGEYPAALRAAQAAMALVTATGKAGHSIKLADLGVYRLLLQVSRPSELAEFSTHILQPLMDEDARTGGDLLATLRTYLDAGCRARRTAEQMVVHPNTVSYRLRRIEGVLGIDLHRPEALLKAQLALMVDDILA